MHYTPAQVRAMSLYEFAACVDGVNRANDTEQNPEAMSPAEFDDLLERHSNFMTVH